MKKKKKTNKNSTYTFRFIKDITGKYQYVPHL